jgi:uncharacterized membrane protein YgaE (UPF0421/DUF939 family)
MERMHRLTSSPLFGAVVGAIVALILFQILKFSPILFLLVILSPLCLKRVRASVISYWKEKKVG